METPENKGPTRYGGGCSRCPAKPGDEPAAPGGLHGWRLAAPAAGMFLAPVALAIAGAAAARGEPGRQFLGALCGLAAGLVGAVVVAWRLRARHADKEGA